MEFLEGPGNLLQPGWLGRGLAAAVPSGTWKVEDKADLRCLPRLEFKLTRSEQKILFPLFSKLHPLSSRLYIYIAVGKSYTAST